jgi:hypothetical protein
MAINEDESYNSNNIAPLYQIAHDITNIIKEDASQHNAHMFCFAAFADKCTGTLYNGLTGAFPFMSLEGNVCFLVLYHYKTNAIMALPISGFSAKTIMVAYKQQYELLASKGHIIKLNVIDNQGSQIIKKILTAQQCNLMLVKPHNHHVNACDPNI